MPVVYVYAVYTIPFLVSAAALCILKYVLAKRGKDTLALLLPILALVQGLSEGWFPLLTGGLLFLILALTRRGQHPKPPRE